ncbi:MAG TPA: hypothetical protein VHV10_17990 [Ktedonobacteraceae bacterium]|nr:hypothetical protein [Ktedonobacteraceae bacterium]
MVGQASGESHGPSQRVPRLIDGGHIPHPQVDQVPQSVITSRHLLSQAILLVTLVGRGPSLIHNVIGGQVRVEHVAEVFVWLDLILVNG